MKKVTLALLTLLLAVVVTGCTNTPPQNLSSAASISESTQQTESSSPNANPQPEYTNPANGASSVNSQSRRIRIRFNGGEIIAVLEENPAAQSLFDQLPVTVTFSDFAGSEKIAYFPTAFAQQGAPMGHQPQSGDICIYAPWGNLAVYYSGSSYHSSLIPMGRIESGLEALTAQTSDFEATVEAVA